MNRVQTCDQAARGQQTHDHAGPGPAHRVDDDDGLHPTGTVDTCVEALQVDRQGRDSAGLVAPERGQRQRQSPRTFVRLLEVEASTIRRTLSAEEVVAVAFVSSAVPSQGPWVREQVTVTVVQALDLAQVDVVRAALSFVLADRALTPGAEIVLEMSACDFVDGTGYGLLCEAAAVVQERGFVLHLTGVRPEVARVLARLDQVLRGGVQQHVLDPTSTVTAAGPTARRPQHARVTIGCGNGITASASVRGVVGDAGDGVRAWS